MPDASSTVTENQLVISSDTMLEQCFAMKYMHYQHMGKVWKSIFCYCHGYKSQPITMVLKWGPTS